MITSFVCICATFLTDQKPKPVKFLQKHFFACSSLFTNVEAKRALKSPKKEKKVFYKLRTKLCKY